MKLYVLYVHDDDFTYDEVDQCIVIAKTLIDAFKFAKRERDVRWVLGEEFELKDIKETTHIATYVHHG